MASGVHESDAVMVTASVGLMVGEPSSGTALTVRSGSEPSRSGTSAAVPFGSSASVACAAGSLVTTLNTA